MAHLQQPISSLPTKYVFITGANSGIGLSVVKRLLEKEGLKCQYNITLGCRNVQKAEAVITELKGGFPNAQLSLVQVDVSSVASVLAASETIKKTLPRIDVFFANAGVFDIVGLDWAAVWRHITQGEITLFLSTGGEFLKQPRNRMTKEGLGFIFATNVFGHYLMLRELEDTLSENSKVIWTGSGSANGLAFTMDDIQHIRGATPYQSSKYLTDLTVHGLNLEYEEKNKKIHCMSTDPGFILSPLTWKMIPAWLWLIVLPIICLFRSVVETVCLDAYNGTEALIYAEELDHKEIEPAKQFYSCCNLQGANVFTGSGGERWTESRRYDFADETCIKVINYLEKLRSTTRDAGISN